MTSKNRFLKLMRGWLPKKHKQARSLIYRRHMLGNSAVFVFIAALMIGSVSITLIVAAISRPLQNPGSSPTGPFTILGASLPWPGRSYTSAVYDGSKVYIFGGDKGGEKTDQIVVFDPVEETVSHAKVSLPYKMTTTAVWTGKYIYLFGGALEYIPVPNLVDNPPALDVVIRYDPSVPSVEVMEAKLPSPRFAMSAVWDGEYVYIFGGGFGQRPKRYGGNWYDDILRYDPSTDTMEVMLAKLPTPRDRTVAFYDGEYIYIIGGITSTDYTQEKLPNESFAFLGEVLRYNPKTDSVETLTRCLRPLVGMSCVWNGQSAYMFGGVKSGGGYSIEDFASKYVWEYVPGDTRTQLIAELPEYLTAASAIWDGHNAYLFGGVKGLYVTSDILKFTPEIEPTG